MHWGLIPHWAKQRESNYRMINARAETVAEKPAFRSPFRHRRCLIPADGFYEWESAEQGRTPHWVYRADGHPMVFAGIWASRIDPETEEWHRTCSIITGEAQGTIKSIHDRMPIALVPTVWDRWLNRDLRDPEEANSLLQPIETDAVMEHIVSRGVNSVRNKPPGLRDQIEPETLF